MLIIVFVCLVEIIISISIAYGIYKLIWYAVKMIALKSTMKKMSRGNVVVEPQRKLSDIVYGKKGPADYIITVGDKKYEVSVLSFISTHGRWNIEKNRRGFRIESRRASKVFFGKSVNSNLPDYVTEYKGESRVSRKELFLTPTNEEFDKQILLLYPYPANITYSDTHFNILYPGDVVESHIIMKIDGIKELIDQAK